MSTDPPDSDSGRAPAPEGSERLPEQEPQIRGVLPQFLAVLGGDAASRVLDGVASILIARILGPVGMGVWAQISLVLSVTDQADFGIRNGMEREAPLALGRQDPERVEAVERTTFGVTLASALISVVAIAVVLTFVAEIEVRAYWWAWLLVIPMVLCSEAFEFVMLSLECRQRFETSSVLGVGFSLCSAALSVALAALFGIVGLLCGIGLSYVVLLGIAVRLGARLPKPGFVPGVAADLWRIGLPLMAVEMLELMLIAADRLLIWVWLGTEPLGTYAVTSMAIGAVNVVPAVLAAVLFPRIVHMFGRTGSVESLHPYFERPTVIMSACASLAIGGLCMLWPFILTWLLPGYEDGILPGQILLLGSIFLVASEGAESMLEAAGHQRLLLGLSGVAVVVGVAVDVIALAAGWGLVGVACGTALALALDGVLVLHFAVLRTRLPRRASVRMLLSVMLPFGAVLGGIVAVSSWRSGQYDVWWHDLAVSLGQAAAVVACGGIALVVVHLCTGAFRRAPFESDGA